MTSKVLLAEYKICDIIILSNERGFIMKTFENYIRDRYNVEMPKGNIPGEWFMKSSFPMVVKCACCEMTMASPCAWVDDEGYTYCADCAGVRREEE